MPFLGLPYLRARPCPTNAPNAPHHSQPRKFRVPFCTGLQDDLTVIVPRDCLACLCVVALHRAGQTVGISFCPTNAVHQVGGFTASNNTTRAFWAGNFSLLPRLPYLPNLPRIFPEARHITCSPILRKVSCPLHSRHFDVRYSMFLFKAGRQVDKVDEFYKLYIVRISL